MSRGAAVRKLAQNDRQDLSAELISVIERNFEREQVPFLQELVRVASDNPAGDCAPHAAHTAILLETMGFEVERHPVPEAVVRQHGMLSVTNLVIRRMFGDGEGPVLALNAHGDVVPPGGGWTCDPYGGTIIEGRLFGRGAAVSKSDFSTYIFALRALAERGNGLNGQVEVHLTYDEETGGHLGPGWLLDQGITRPDYVISAGFTYDVMIAHNGSLQLDVRLAGVAAHSAWPETGQDAIEACTRIMQALYQYRDGLSNIRSDVEKIDTPTLVIGVISGGVAANIVPEMAQFRLERRILPDEDPALVEADLRTLILDAASGVPCQIERHLLADPLVPSAGQTPLVEALQDAAQSVLGELIPASGMPLFTDARLYAKAGIPTVLYGAGPRDPRDANGHRANEHVVLDDLRRATEVVALALSRLLQ